MTMFNRFGPKVYIPEGQSLIELVRATMLQPDTQAAAKSVDISWTNYQLVRKLLILQDRKILSQAEEEKVQQALYVLSVERRYNKAYNLVTDVLARYWHGKSRNGEFKDAGTVRAKLKLKNRFHKTVFAIRETCTNNDELEIPPSVTREEREEAKEIIIESVQALWTLLNKIRQQE
jgi:hypothetical protein